MTYAILRSTPTIWREGASKRELARVAQIDAELDAIEHGRAELTNERRILTNRACQRQRARFRRKGTE